MARLVPPSNHIHVARRQRAVGPSESPNSRDADLFREGDEMLILADEEQERRVESRAGRDGLSIQAERTRREWDENEAGFPSLFDLRPFFPSSREKTLFTFSKFQDDCFTQTRGLPLSSSCLHAFCLIGWHSSHRMISSSG